MAEPEREMSLPAGTPTARHQRGQTLVFVALILVVLVGFLALSIDLGNVYAQRRFMQNAADAAALAGARALALDRSQAAAEAEARAFAIANGAASCIVTCTFEVTGASVTVVASKPAETFFASALGVPVIDVGAVAAAHYTFASGGIGVIPIALHESLWTTGVTYTIFSKDTTETLGDGSTIVQTSQRGWLNLDGEIDADVDANELKCWVCPDTCPEDPEIDLGWVNGTPGMDTSVLQALECQLGKEVIVPIFRDACSTQGDPNCPEDIGNGQSNYDIVGFAVFKITAIQHKTNYKYVQGHFVKGPFTNPNMEGGGDEDYGIRIVNLIR
ncbi:MAG: Tad domain-containing protein [Anaerolineae bacterium]|nr:Tad domain-containing protein [Anaerolineae bacterium]